MGALHVQCLDAQVLFFRKTRENCMFARQIVSTQPPILGNYEYEEITIHVGSNSPIHYLKYDL
jgi:hypothetical protein